MRTPEQFERWSLVVVMAHNHVVVGQDPAIAHLRPWENKQRLPTPQRATQFFQIVRTWICLCSGHALKGSRSVQTWGGFLLADVASIAQQALRPCDWQTLSASLSTKGERLIDWARLPPLQAGVLDSRSWLVVRCCLDDPSQLAYLLACALPDTSLLTILRLSAHTGPLRFQSSPAREGWRNKGSCLSGLTNSRFQSSPAREGWRNA